MAHILFRKYTTERTFSIKRLFINKICNLCFEELTKDNQIISLIYVYLIGLRFRQIEGTITKNW